MARGDSSQIGILGTGFQARGQLRGFSAVRRLKTIKAFSRNVERRKSFCSEMERLLEIETIPVENPEDVIKGSDIVITSTTSAEPVFKGELIEKGVHINATGGNFLFKREIDETVVRKSDIIIVESIEQSKIEAGEFLPPIEKGRLQWEQIHELGEVVVGKVKGRIKDEEITLFKSLGVAIEDIAVAAHIYEQAKNKGIGQELQIPSI